MSPIRNVDPLKVGLLTLVVVGVLLSIHTALLGGSSASVGAGTPSHTSSGSLGVVTWNVAAINNNPFEYWITHDDPAYDAMMKSVRLFVEEDVVRRILPPSPPAPHTVSANVGVSPA